MTAPFRGNIERLSISNRNYRKVLYTTSTGPSRHSGATFTQLVVMSLKPGEEIGEEKHPHTTQFIRVEEGRCTVHISSRDPLAGQVYRLTDGDSVVIPAKTLHNVINTGTVDLKLYTIYSGALEHEDGLVERYKSD